MIVPHGCKRAAVFWDLCQGLREGKERKKGEGSKAFQQVFASFTKGYSPRELLQKGNAHLESWGTGVFSAWYIVPLNKTGVL